VWARGLEHDASNISLRGFFFCPRCRAGTVCLDSSLLAFGKLCFLAPAAAGCRCVGRGILNSKMSIPAFLLFTSSTYSFRDTHLTSMEIIFFSSTLTTHSTLKRSRAPGTGAVSPRLVLAQPTAECHGAARPPVQPAYMVRPEAAAGREAARRAWLSTPPSPQSPNGRASSTGSPCMCAVSRRPLGAGKEGFLTSDTHRMRLRYLESCGSVVVARHVVKISSSSRVAWISPTTGGVNLHALVPDRTAVPRYMN
jgi:hypothetical protein